MDPEEVLHRCGGLASRAELLLACPRGDIDRAVLSGRVVRLAAGRLALPGVAEAQGTAHRLTGVLSHASAALEHGWEVVSAPDLPHVMVRRGRHLTSEQRAGAHVHVGEVSAGELRRRVVDPSRALDQCLRALPLPEALAVADSALRHGVDASLLRDVADTAHGPGSRQVRRVCGLADARAPNPFESALRGLCSQVEDLAVEPQREIAEPGLWARPDLVDEHLRVVVEADSFAWHGSRSALCKDARRYNLLVAHGWLVLRFSWEDVMFRQERVRRILAAVVALRRTQRAPDVRRPA